MKTVASIDCGTNSTRLLIAEVDSEGRLSTKERLMRITRLGEGVEASGTLRDEALERTAKVLSEYRVVMERHGVAAGAVRVAATAAARDASNREEFFDRVQREVGVRAELLSGEEEARLSFVGATARSQVSPAHEVLGLGLNRNSRMVFDLGGGSTEFAVGVDEPTAFKSVPIGCVRLTERFFESDPPRPEDLTAAISYASTWIDEVMREIPGVTSASEVIGLAGTVSTVAAVEIGLAEYDRDRLHGFVLTREAVEDVFRTLATEPLADRVHNPGLEAGRADVIVGGCCALVAIFRTFGLEKITVSESDILDGLAIAVAASFG